MTRGGRGFLGMVYRIEAKRVKAYEAACIEAFDRSVVVSPVDRQALIEALPENFHERVSVIPIGVHGEIRDSRARPFNPNLIVLFGNLRTHQNNDAALYFAREIYPRIKEKRPDAVFRIIGANPSREVRMLHGKSGIEVTGRVERIAEHAEQAGVSVCPIRIGAGMKGKILESMAMELPVVTTAMGAEGIEGARSGEECLIAGTPEEFAAATLSLMEDEHLNERIAKNGRDFVSAHYRYDAVARPYAAFF
jgi:glycosyltransferase involved in cell wall biosynthesis